MAIMENVQDKSCTYSWDLNSYQIRFLNVQFSDNVFVRCEAVTSQMHF